MTRLLLTPIVYGVKYPIAFLVLVGGLVGLGMVRRRGKMRESAAVPGLLENDEIPKPG